MVIESPIGCHIEIVLTQSRINGGGSGGDGIVMRRICVCVCVCVTSIYLSMMNWNRVLTVGVGVSDGGWRCWVGTEMVVRSIYF